MNLNKNRSLYLETREKTIKIVENLRVEDFNLQASDFVSPVKWHLAHTTWFFEQFILIPFYQNYKPFDSTFSHLFNSYYDTVGARIPRGKRHLISRPDLKTIFQYREYVDSYILKWIDDQDHIASVNLELGIHHEMQHQELIFTDTKYNAFQHPLYFSLGAESEFKDFEFSMGNKKIKEGIYEIGHSQINKFHFDNEAPNHKVYINEFEILNSYTKANQFIDFIEDGGYTNPLLWHADGWLFLQRENKTAPLYWRKGSFGWEHFTRAGWLEIRDSDPLAHISYYEAFAFSEWFGARLPTEFEWEVANLENTGFLWEHTSSPYIPYPGFQKPLGAIGEYNGKFMVNQYVLRGGSLYSPHGHIRKTYRNFFYPEDSWQYNGIRLVRK
jgi:ergothioneine biosynthesis protein EgtB